MTANQYLLFFLVVFWFLLCVAAKVSNFFQGKSFSDGPSLIPVTLIVPGLALAVGTAINWRWSPYGTVAVVVFHLGWIVIASVLIYRNPSRPT